MPPTDQPLRVAVTGGIGAGKSTICAAFAERGGHIVDADAIARDVVRPGSETLAHVVAEFGSRIIGDEGALNRPALGRIVFTDQSARRRLNAIMHPAIRRETAHRMKQAPAGSVIVHDIPLLAEVGAHGGYAIAILARASVDVRVSRLVEHRGMTPDDARARIRAQASDTAREVVTDLTLSTAGSLSQTTKGAASLWEQICTTLGTLATEVPSGITGIDPMRRRRRVRLALEQLGADTGVDTTTAALHVRGDGRARAALRRLGVHVDQNGPSHGWDVATGGVVSFDETGTTCTDR